MSLNNVECKDFDLNEPIRFAPYETLKRNKKYSDIMKAALLGNLMAESSSKYNKENTMSYNDYCEAPPMRFGTKAKTAAERTYNNTIAPLAVASVNAYDADEAARARLLERVSDVKFKIKNTFVEKFHIYGWEPKTVGEYKEALAKGWYKLVKFGTDGTQEAKDDTPMAYVNREWTHPDYVKDRAGYDQAKLDLEAEATKVKDDIYVLPVADGLAALRAFEKWEPTVAPVAKKK